MTPLKYSRETPLWVGRYEIIRRLATGGMAQIYLARHGGLGSFERHVVLKTISRAHASDPQFVTMLLDEARLAATLNHQSIAQVYEVAIADGAYFIAMEYVHGENVRAVIDAAKRRGWTIPLEVAVTIVTNVAAGLQHAHVREDKQGQPLGIVHRDVSPANIMVGFDGSVKILDFGIAKGAERATKTAVGVVKGKHGYMSPEQCMGPDIDARSDIFALGICLYELTTMQRAFTGADDLEAMTQIVHGDVVRPSLVVADYPPELEAIVMTALARDPSARFQSAHDMIEALEEFAARAHLAGSSSAMVRFMAGLFGSRDEPWCEAPHDEVTEPDIEPGRGPTFNSAPRPTVEREVRVVERMAPLVDATPTDPRAPRRRMLLFVVLAVIGLGVGAALAFVAGSGTAAP